jgi:hypothetical protein
MLSFAAESASERSAADVGTFVRQDVRRDEAVEPVVVVEFESTEAEGE